MPASIFSSRYCTAVLPLELQHHFLPVPAVRRRRLWPVQPNVSHFRPLDPSGLLSPAFQTFSNRILVKVLNRSNFHRTVGFPFPMSRQTDHLWAAQMAQDLF